MRARLPAPFGHVSVEVEGEEVRTIRLAPEPADEEVPEEFPDPVLVALRAYLEGRAPRPIAPMAVEGTEFQWSVWEALTDIPPGKTLTYGELAETLGKPGAARAVGQALRNNPLPLMLPCHRVVARDGLGGFGGASEREDPEAEGQLRIKSWLLDHEAEMTGSRRRK